MKRWIGAAASVVTLVAVYSLHVFATIPAVPSGIWSATADMAHERAGAAGTLLPDGRVLMTGGVDADGVTASVERFSPGSSAFLATPPMQSPRANHTATLLADGRVLVAGGMGADGRATSWAEIYDPSVNAWLTSGSMTVARRGHTATLLADGHVLIAGGDDSGVPTDTLELFDPASATFSAAAGTLSAARTLHAAAELPDGRVLIVGGSDGTNALASTDIYDSNTGTVAAGPSLSTARSGASATTLLDGKVLVAGGANGTTELSSAEVFDPASSSFSGTDTALAAARQNHLAFLLPHNNNVLIVGGTAGGSAVATAELYAPWQGTGGTFCSTGVCVAAPAAPGAARAWATGSALSFPASAANRSGPVDGLLLLAGGTGLKSAELFGFATIKTDKDDYAPGQTVTVTGSGWKPGELVALTLEESPNLDQHPLVAVQADESGNIISTEFSPDQHDADVRFYLTAFGSESEAQTTFTDSTQLKKVTVIGSQHANPVIQGGSTTYGTTAADSVQVDFNGSGSCTVALSVISGLPADATGTFSPGQQTGTGTESKFSLLTIQASTTTPAGTFTFTVQAQGTGGTGNNCTTSETKTATATLVVAPKINTTTAVASSLDPSTYGQSVTFTATITKASGSATPTGTVQFQDGGVDLGAPQSVSTTGGLTTATLMTSTLAAGSHLITAIYSGDATFRGSASPTLSQTVAQKAVTGSFIADNKEYDGTPAAAILTRSLGGVLGSDAVSLDGGTASFADKNVANGKTVTATGFTLTGADAGNYSLAAGPWTTTADITPKSVTGSFTTYDKEYDGNTTAAIVTRALTGQIAGDDVALDGGTATFADKNAGNAKTVTATGFTLGGTDAGNYTLTPGPWTATASITPKSVTGSFTASDKEYDGTTGATITSRVLPAADVISGDDVQLSGGTATFDNKNVGAGKVVTGVGFALSGAQAGNYSLASTTLTAHADITPKALAGSFTANNKMYDGGTMATVATMALATIVSGDTVSLVVTNAHFDSKNVGMGKTVTANLSLSGGDAGNYTVNAAATASADITPRTLTVSATGIDKNYDGTTTATVTLSDDRVSGDILSISYASASFGDKFAGPNKPVTVLGITVAGVDAGNYTWNTTTTTTASILSWWTVNGFYQPVTMSAIGGPIVFNTIKGGSTVPLKFNIYAGSVERTSTSDVLSFALAAIACGGGYETIVDGEFSTTGGTALRYDGGAGQFIQNWQTPRAPGACYQVTMTAADGTKTSAYFKLK